MSRNRMNQKMGNKGEIDGRTRQDIEERIRELAASYVPEWDYDPENLDIGAVISRLYAAQMEGNIERYNQVLEKYRTEFVNMLGITLLPSRPAQSVVLMDVVQDTIEGAQVGKGTKLTAQSGETEVVFETTHDLYVSNARLQYIFMTEEEKGKLVPIRGSFLPAAILEPAEEEPEEEEPEEEILPEREEPFRLFASGRKGIQQNMLLFYHPTIMDLVGGEIYLKLCGGEKITEHIRRGDYRFFQNTEEGLAPLEDVRVLADGETVVIRKDRADKKIQLGTDTYTLLGLEALCPVRENLRLSGVRLWAQGKDEPPAAVNDGATDLDVGEFDPFGDTLSLFQECYVGHDEYFSKAGATVQIRFDVSYREHRLMLDMGVEDNSLKIIKRKPRVVYTDALAESRAEQISLEYYNGIGWKKLVCDQENGQMFSTDNAGSYEISFVCPKDWQQTEIGAYSGRCIRIQLLRAENCYMRPAIHHYPHIKNMQISFSYQEHDTEPERLTAICGTSRVDLTARLKSREPFLAFSRGDYQRDALYLGLSRRIASGPASLLFQMEEGQRFEGTKCYFEYSTGKGFKRMKVVDRTADMSRSGIVMFMPQADMQPVTIEGKTACWIRISRAESEPKPQSLSLPVIRGVSLNAVQVTNVETLSEEDYFIDEIRPNLEVLFGTENILDVDLWVNERADLTRQQMQSLLEERPQDVRAEYDMLGEITEFFVKWEEADQLDDPPSPRSYMLDRMNNKLIFGDGIHAKIPKVLDDVAYRITVRRCNGQAGNVEEGTINAPFHNLLFVEHIYNPVKAYGGSDIESLNSALDRGANILKSRRRLVSEEDYVNEIRGFSDVIEKVRCVPGQLLHGEYSDGALTFVILLRDFTEGSYSFHNLSGELKKHLLERCEMTVDPSQLYIVEPIFVRISVDVWVEVARMDDSFALQSLLEETLEQYLDPRGSEAGPGWEIGVLPKRAQLLMKMNVLKNRALVKEMVVTASYTDQEGSHEKNLDDLEASPFMICCSGRHRVNIMTKE